GPLRHGRGRGIFPARSRAGQERRECIAPGHLFGAEGRADQSRAGPERQSMTLKESTSLDAGPDVPLTHAAQDKAETSQWYELVVGAGGGGGRSGQALCHSRELFFFRGGRDILVRYKKTPMGLGGALIRPLLTILVSALVFGQLAGMAAAQPDTP